jgi:HlyD family secretion protein
MKDKEKDSTIFRKVALDRLASPEQLDQLLPVTDSQGWVALAALGTVLLAAFGWGVLGSVPQNVSGTGILVKSGGVLDVLPVAGGLVTDLAVNVGDSVSEGQVVARVAQPEVSARLREARAVLVDLRERHQKLSEFGDKNLALQADNLARERAAVEQSMASARSVLGWTRKKIRVQGDLVARGLVLKQTLLESQEKKHQALEQVSKGKSQLAQIAVKELELRTLQQQQLAESQAKIAEAQRTVEQTSREFEIKSQIASPYTGRILEILAEQGMVVAAGEPILRLDLAGRTVRGLEAIIFVPSSQGKQVQVGMPVLISPATIKKEEYGRMLARVTSVSDFPATIKGMQRVLKNEKLVQTLAGTDAPYEIHADLVVDPTTTSQYRWSSSKGPPERIRSGTLATADVAVLYRRPIQLLIPTIRSKSGL